MARHIRQGDTVFINAGKDKGRTGKVLRVLPDKQRVVVEGINVRRKHVRPSQENQQGGVIDIEMPIHWSNVNPAIDGKPTRVRFQTHDDGSKTRVAASNGEQIGPPLKKPRQ
jgi:large subunit ribosomal protein L24